MDYFNETTATQLDAKRERARQKQRIIYDCYNALYPTDGQSKVQCFRGYPLTRLKRGVSVLEVLRGRASKACQDCEDYRKVA